MVSVTVTEQVYIKDNDQDIQVSMCSGLKF